MIAQLVSEQRNLVSYKIHQESIKTEAVFTKTEMNNE